MTKSKIEWTDATWPVVTGCAPVSPGCEHCYAARMAATRLKHHPRYEGLAVMQAGKAQWTGKVKLNLDVLEQPLRWKKPRMIFVAPMGDLFHGNVPRDFIIEVWNIMLAARHHTFQVLTKRPARAVELLNQVQFPYDVCGIGHFDWPLPNVWLGVSAENQAMADERTPLLLQTPAAVRFASCEPLLGPVDLSKWLSLDQWLVNPLNQSGLGPATLDWVIVGGESGPHARPMHPDWARSIRDQCQAADVPFFFKQWGAWFPRSQWEDNPDLILPDDDRCVEGRDCKIVDDDIMHRIGKKRAGRLLDGALHEEYPK